MRYHNRDPFEGAIGWSMKEIKFFVDQLIAYEESKEVARYVEVFKQIWEHNKSLDKDEIQTYLVELKLNQKLENGPMAIFSIMDENEERNERLYDLISSEFNFAALIKWVNITESIDKWESTYSIDLLNDISRNIQWDFMEDIWSGDMKDSYQRILAVTAKKNKEQAKKVISFEDCDSIQYLLQNIGQYNSDNNISKKEILNKMRLLALTGDYVLPLDWCLALKKVDYDEEYDNLITTLFKEQYGNMKKLPGVTKILLDGSGSMFTHVHLQIGNQSQYVSRMEIASYFAFMMYIMSVNAEVFFAISDGQKHLNFKVELDQDTTIGVFAKMARNITSHEGIKKLGMYDIGDGIYTAHSLHKFVKMGCNPSTIDTLFVFSDSGDCAEHMEYPNQPEVLVAKNMYNVNVAHGEDYNHVIQNAQWKGYFNGYSNYLLEKVFWDRGICNPLFKAAEFTGESYRISF